MRSPIVAKVGGSLFDLSDLRERLIGWATEQRERPVLFIPGGGEAADAVRKLDRIHQLGEEKSHWLAIRMMSANAHFLAGLLHIPVVSSPLVHLAEGAGKLASVLDPLQFCETDPQIEHSWRVTSDSIAARVAIALDADLALLKSVALPPGISWRETAEAGLLDDFFPTLVENASLKVTWVNLRHFPATPPR